jgi:hypothetical protein
MAAKRRERLAKFLAERNRLRKREKHPFQPPSGVSASATGPLNKQFMYMYMYTHVVYM